jgi:hypothetical protein
MFVLFWAAKVREYGKWEEENLGEEKAGWEETL